MVITSDFDSDNDGSIPSAPATLLSMMNKRQIYEYVYQDYTNKIYAFVEFDFEKRNGAKELLTIEHDSKTFKQTGIVSKEDYSWVIPLFKLRPVFLDGRSSLCDIATRFKRKTLMEFCEYSNSVT